MKEKIAIRQVFMPEGSVREEKLFELGQFGGYENLKSPTFSLRASLCSLSTVRYPFENFHLACSGSE